MTTNNIEQQVQDLLHHRAESIDEDAITGDSVRRYADRRHRRTVAARAPLAAAAAVAALIAGVILAVGSGGDAPSPPAGSQHPPTGTPTTRGGFGNVPPCPKTTRVAGSRNTVCSIGHAPSVPVGSAVIHKVPQH